MPKQPKKKVAPVKEVTSARRNGKAPKKNPKSNPEPTGRTIGGYSPTKLAARSIKRGKVV